MNQRIGHQNKAVIGIGGNLASSFGTVLQTVLESIRFIGEIEGVEIVKQSAIYRTKAWPEGSEQPDYANMAVLAEVNMDATQLLLALQAIENEMGRVRDKRWGERVIDLDVLAFDDSILPDEAAWNSVAESDDPAFFLKEATVPHPRLHKRLFALKPFVDVYGEWLHPVLGQTAAQLEEAVLAADNQPLGLYEEK